MTKNIAEILTIRSGKKGPKIKKGITDDTTKFVKNLFEYLKLFLNICINHYIKKIILSLY